MYRSNGEKIRYCVLLQVVPGCRARKESVPSLTSLLSIPCILKEMTRDLLFGMIFILGDGTKLGKRLRWKKLTIAYEEKQLHHSEPRAEDVKSTDAA